MVTRATVGAEVAGSRLCTVSDSLRMVVEIPSGCRIRTVGVDLTDISRIRRMVVRYESSLVHRICGAVEQSTLAKYPSEMRAWGMALAFGIKECVIKAAGGIPHGGRFIDTDSSALLRAGLMAAERPPARPEPVRGSEFSGVVSVSGETGVALRHHDGAEPILMGGARCFQPQLLICWVLSLEGASA